MGIASWLNTKKSFKKGLKDVNIQQGANNDNRVKMRGDFSLFKKAKVFFSFEILQEIVRRRYP